MTVSVKTAKGAEGAIALSAGEGTTRAKVSRTAHTFTFTAAKSGRWRITVSFTGARGWNSQKLRKSLTVPATGASAQTVLSTDTLSEHLSVMAPSAFSTEPIRASRSSTSMTPSTTSTWPPSARR